MIGAGLGGAQGGSFGDGPQTLGENVLRPWLASGVRLSRSGRSAKRPGCSRLQPCGLWLHHLHRQLRPAATRNFYAPSAEGDLVATAVLSGNRNFEGRISPDVRANYLASPPLVVAYALAGTLDINLATDVIGQDRDGNDVYLRDIWPTTQEVAEMVEATVTREAFLSKYADVFKGDEKWQAVEVTNQKTYDWPSSSTYVQNPPYFQGITMETHKITNLEGCQGHRDFGRYDHNGPHLTGRLVQRHYPCR